MAPNEQRWWTEHREEDGAGNNTQGVITMADGHTFTYDVEGLTEYSIEKNRADAVKQATAYAEDHLRDPQHDFANETSTHSG